MKIKEFIKKLTLKKETISNLNLEELLVVKGGGSTYITVCASEYCSIIETCEGHSCDHCPRFDYTSDYPTANC
jgi:hypothetical protein